ncbi:O-fucosyltransferase 39-like [Rosa rugosa]|uniref:O-fucosyltransferase 39-like n=1 Tax=Rosa rugosa TaxID=74645 RepID=UPI002B4151A9|nr:O-fucosyltransferase 39-like [Rosa rugosa]
MALKPFVNQLGYVNVPQEINRLRCGVNYHALKFLPEIEQMADLLASRMRNRTGSSNPFMYVHFHLIGTTQTPARFSLTTFHSAGPCILGLRRVRLKRYLEMTGADGGLALEKLMCFACILDMAWRPSTLMKV